MTPRQKVLIVETHSFDAQTLRSFETIPIQTWNHQYAARHDSPDITVRMHAMLSSWPCTTSPINCASMRCCDHPTAEIQAGARGETVSTLAQGIFTCCTVVCRCCAPAGWAAEPLGLCTASRLFLKMHKCKSCAKMHGANWKSYYEVEVLLAVHQRRASPSWVVTKDADFQLGIQEWSVLQLGIINSLRSWMVPLKETRAARQAIAHLALETTPGCTKDSPRCQV